MQILWLENTSLKMPARHIGMPSELLIRFTEMVMVIIQRIGQYLHYGQQA